MLVLSRRAEESFLIGDDIIVTVVDIRGANVRLGVNAPRDVGVHRQEVYEAIQREGQRHPPQDTQSPIVRQIRTRFPFAAAFHYANADGEIVWAILDRQTQTFLSGPKPTEPDAWRGVLSSCGK